MIQTRQGVIHWERGHPVRKKIGLWFFCLNHDEKDLMITMIKKSFPSFNQVNQGSRQKENEAMGNSLGARTSCPQKIDLRFFYLNHDYKD